ncbi:MAG: methyl-accepting chemotaxis protein [Syntrophaceae bacterium]|nr:methyl-accepting chemotaxis protein [Syntrophaceae bacterium]
MNFLRNLKVGSKILSGYVLVFLLMVFSTTYLVLSNNAAVEKYVNLVEQNLPAIQHAVELRATVLDMQSSFRGFVITGKNNFITHYTESRSKFDDLLVELKKHLGNDPKQLALLDEVKRLEMQWVQTVAEPGIAKRRDFESSIPDGRLFLNEFSSMLSSGKSIIEEIRTKLEVFIRFENDITTKKAVEAAESNYRLNILTTALNLGLVIIMFTIGILTSLSIQRPLRKVSDQMALLAKGGADLSFRIAADRKDEIGELSRNFNEFIASLANMMSKLAEGSVRLASASEQIKASGQEMTRGAENQLGQVLKTSSAMEEMSNSIQEVSKNARVTADSAVAASSLAREGSEKLRTTLVGIEAVDESIRKLNLRTQEIGRVVQLISGIAAQTNILALNAAIEAARAGEHGRGFDVVAEEIRKLSLRTTESTAEISAVIEEIQQETSHAAQMMETGAHMAREAGQTLNDIVEGIVSTTDMVGMISGAAGQQAITAEEIADAFQKIAQVSEQSTATLKESSRAMVDVVDLSNQLKEITSQFKL